MFYDTVQLACARVSIFLMNEFGIQNWSIFS